MNADQKGPNEVTGNTKPELEAGMLHSIIEGLSCDSEEDEKSE